MPRVYPTGHLIHEVPLVLRNGRRLKLFMFQTARATGRRLKVIDLEAAGGEPVFDSGDCYDSANAQNALDFWIAANDDPPAELLTKFLAGFVPAGPSIERTYFDHWSDRTAPPQVCDVCKEVMDTEDQGQRTGDTVVCSPCIHKGGGVRLASQPQ